MKVEKNVSKFWKFLSERDLNQNCVGYNLIYTLEQGCQNRDFTSYRKGITKSKNRKIAIEIEKFYLFNFIVSMQGPGFESQAPPKKSKIIKSIKSMDSTK